MEYVHVLSVSTTQGLTERVLGIFEDAELAREAGVFWSTNNGHSSDLSWHKVGYNLETVQIGQYDWLHVKAIKANKLIE
jgi:hypothetical protein